MALVIAMELICSQPARLIYSVLLSWGKQGHYGISEIGLTLEAICCIIGITWLPRKMNSTKPQLLPSVRCCRMSCSYGDGRFWVIEMSGNKEELSLVAPALACGVVTVNCVDEYNSVLVVCYVKPVRGLEWGGKKRREGGGNDMLGITRGCPAEGSHYRETRGIWCLGGIFSCAGETAQENEPRAQTG